MPSKRGQRGLNLNNPPGADQVGMPTRVFLFTVDQLSVMLDLPEKYIRDTMLYYEGRSIGTIRKWELQARNIAPPDEKPEWRITEREFIRWLKYKGFKHYDRGAVY